MDNGAVKHDAGEGINEMAEQVLTQGDSLVGRHHIVPNAVQTQLLTSHVRPMAHRAITGDPLPGLDANLLY